jgi:hypothetical protein
VLKACFDVVFVLEELITCCACDVWYDVWYDAEYDAWYDAEYDAGAELTATAQLDEKSLGGHAGMPVRRAKGVSGLLIRRWDISVVAMESHCSLPTATASQLLVLARNRV